MNYTIRKSLTERQAAMRERQKEPVAAIDETEIRRACEIYNRALCEGPALTEDVTALLVQAGIKHSASVIARKWVGVEERIPRGVAWLHISTRAMAAHAFGLDLEEM
jgi:hypothetical protein